MTRSHNTFSSSSSSSSSYSSVSQHLPNVNDGTGGSTASFGLFGCRPPPSRYSSLPSFSVIPSVVAPPPAFRPPLHQPPLLPLPYSRSAALPSPSPTDRIAASVSAVTTARSRDHRKKTKSDGNPRKEARSLGTTSLRSDMPKGESVSLVPQKSAQKPATAPAAAELERKVKEGGEEKEERFAMEAVYSLSPPPSSLPLPTFFLKRPKDAAAAAAVSCIAEAVGCGEAGGGGRVNAGATDDLRRLLRL